MLDKNFQIAETDTFQRKIRKDPSLKKVYAKIENYVYPILEKNPYFGPNIKSLKGNLSDFHRYRIGDYRLFYKIDEGKVIVFIIDLVHRKDAY